MLALGQATSTSQPLVPTGFERFWDQDNCFGVRTIVNRKTSFLLYSEITASSSTDAFMKQCPGSLYRELSKCSISDLMMMVKSNCRLDPKPTFFKNQIYLFIFLKRSLLEYNCFTILCQFLLHNRANQPHAYTRPHIPSLLSLPPILPIPPLQVIAKH